MQRRSIVSMQPVWRLGLALLLMLALGSCSRSPSEAALRAQLDAMQSAGESRAVGDFMALVADDFVGNSSEFDRRGLERLLRLVALQHQSIGVTRTGLSIEMHGDRAVVRMQLLVTGGNGGLIPEQGQLLDTESAWRFVDGEWQLGSASWQAR